MRAPWIGFLCGSLAAGAVWAVTRTGEASSPKDAAPQTGRSAAKDDGERIERRRLNQRIANLQRALAAGGRVRFGKDELPATDRDLLRWMMRALGGPATADQAAQDRWTNLILGWIADERGIPQEDLEFGPTRERLAAEYLNSRGKPLDPAQMDAFGKFLKEADASFREHLAGTGRLCVEERLISGFRRTADWHNRFISILSVDQRTELLAVDALLETWRWQPACEPRALDPVRGIESAFEDTRTKMGSRFDAARAVLENHVKSCVEMHREVDRQLLVDPTAVSDVDEFCRFLEIRLRTKRQLQEECGIEEAEIPNEALYDWCDAPPDVEEPE